MTVMLKDLLLWVLLVVGGAFGGIVVDRLLLKNAKLVVTETRIMTNNIVNTQYKYVDVTKLPIDCVALGIRHNRMLASYSNYVSCKPFDTSVNGENIQFSLGNDDITNVYRIKVSAAPAPIFNVGAGLCYMSSGGWGVTGAFKAWDVLADASVTTNLSWYASVKYMFLKF